jgi:hypothetical protein
MALSNASHVKDLYVNAFEETNSLFPANRISDEIDKLTMNVSKEVVTVTTLDSFAKTYGLDCINFLKIDVQGGSFEVLEGASTLLQAQMIKIPYVEVEFVQIFNGQRLFSDIELLLRSFGYKFQTFFNVNHIKSGQMVWADALFYANH